jgi:hypothetical protein
VVTATVSERKTPWHLWLVGILTLLWNGSGAATIMLAQAGRLTGLTPDEAAYYAAQPTWLVVTADIALVSAVAAGVALLLRSRAAVWLFGLSLALILVNNAYELAAGTSRMLVSRGAVVLTTVIAVIAILQLIYARTMSRRAVLQ